MPSITEISYQSDSAITYHCLGELADPVWLDSCRPYSRHGRYDILSAEPSLTLTTVGDITTCRGSANYQSHQDPFALIAKHLPPECEHAVVDGEALPFCGGALGFWGYDLARRLEVLPRQAKADLRLPDMWVGIFSWAVVTDHLRQRSFVVSLRGHENARIAALLAANGEQNTLKSILEKKENSFKISGFKENIKPESYLKKIDIIHSHILAGDCYQVNFAQRFSAHCQGDSLAGYLALRQALPSPYAGYLPIGSASLLCLSPERFIAYRDGEATTCPIKGTIGRGATPEQDEANRQQLLASEKDRAENLMIVDLLRNDLSKTCRQVRATELFAIQSFANVHHLVSSVTGELRESCAPLDLLRQAFPGGSITGAPKIRAMAIIEALEPCRRGPYCGSLGYISACTNMDTNIAIRTLVQDNNQLHCWGGGGIVHDSEAEAEFTESVTKVALLMRTLEERFARDQ